MTTNGIETIDFEDVLDMMMLPLTYAHHPLPRRPTTDDSRRSRTLPGGVFESVPRSL